MAFPCQTNNIGVKEKWEFQFWDSIMGSPVDPLSTEPSVTGENDTYKKPQPFQVSGNCPKNIQQMKKYLFKKI